MYRKKINDVKAAVVTAILSILESATSPYIPERLLNSLDSGISQSLSPKCLLLLTPFPSTQISTYVLQYTRQSPEHSTLDTRH